MAVYLLFPTWLAPRSALLPSTLRTAAVVQLELFLIARQLLQKSLSPVLPSTKKALGDEFFAKENTLIDKGRKISANQLKNAKNSSKIYANQKQINEVIDYATQIILLDKKSVKQALKEAKSSLVSISR